MRRVQVAEREIFERMDDDDRDRFETDRKARREKREDIPPHLQRAADPDSKSALLHPKHHQEYLQRQAANQLAAAREEPYEPDQPGVAMARLMLGNATSLERLQRYDRSLELSFQRALRQFQILRKIQADGPQELSDVAKTVLGREEMDEESSRVQNEPNSDGLIASDGPANGSRPPMPSAAICRNSKRVDSADGTERKSLESTVDPPLAA